MISTKKPTVENLIGSIYDYTVSRAPHFFPTMLRVNIIYIIASCVFCYTMINSMGEFMSNFSIPFGNNSFFGYPQVYKLSDGVDFPDVMFQNFSSWNYILMIISGLVILVAGIFFIAFTPAYMILENRNGVPPTYSQIIDFLKKRTGKLIKMVLFGILLYIPVVLIIVFLVVILAITIIGIPFILVLAITLLLLAKLVIFAYLDDEDISFFEAMDKAWNILLGGFWRNVFVALAVYVVIAVVSSIIKLLLGIVTPGMVFTSQSFEPQQMIFTGVMAVFFTMLIQLAAVSLSSINAGMIYFYNTRKDKEEN